MTRAEYQIIFNTLDNVENREKEYCKRYCELNPSEKHRRERDRDIFMNALLQVRFELKEGLRYDTI